MNYISSFLTALSNAGIQLKNSRDIKETNRFLRTSSATDKGAKRSISYWLRIEHDFAFGYAHDFKTGISLKFKSTDPTISKSDMRRVRAEIARREAEEKVRIEERHAKIAERSAAIMLSSVKTGTTPYLERKGIHLLSASRLGQDVIVPIYNVDNEIRSYQRIKPDGTKRFPFGGEKKGNYHLIGQIDPRASVGLVEGFATGASVHLATGYPVVVALDAGNLLPVAKSLRKKYKSAPFIIYADNDKSGVGLKAASDVLSAVPNCSIVMSPICKDWNDHHVTHGIDDLKSRLIPSSTEPSGGGTLSPSHSVQTTAGSDWMEYLSVDSKNRILPYSLKNALLYLQNHEDFAGVFVYDEFKQTMLVKKCPPYEDAAHFKVRKVNDRDATKVSAKLEDYSLLIPSDKAMRAIETVAHDNLINSAKEYFDSLKWDGVPRLENFLFDYLLCTEPHDYLSWVGKKWMTAAIKRIYEPGCKFDHILVLESAMQGTYKSSALKTLATFNGECFHTEGVTPQSTDDKYTPLYLLGVMIAELGEMQGFNRKDDAVLKNWITRTTDKVKLPHDKFVTDYPRQFVLAATTNITIYLKDPTGNRRYWPVSVGGRIDIDALESVKGQLWAEAVHEYKSGLYIGPTHEENEIADRERQKRLVEDLWEDRVLQSVSNLDEFKTSDAIDGLKLKITEQNELTQKRVHNILKMNGFTYEAAWSPKEKKTVKVWRRCD